jgi:hypothetical protein
MNPQRRLTALEKKIGPVEKPGPHHVLVIRPGQDENQMVADFKNANDIKTDDQLWIVEAVAADRQKEETDELQQAD